jgi:hypothetical protein
MNAAIPPCQHDHVLAGAKAKPSGWPAANLDPGSGRGPMTPDRREPVRCPVPQISGLYGSLENQPQAACSRVTLYPSACSCWVSRVTLRPGSMTWVSK